MRTSIWDIVALVEACYRVELSEQSWLEGCAEAARPFMDRGLGYIAVTYDLARSGEEIFPARVLAGPAEFQGNAPDLLRVVPMDLLLEWRRLTIGFASEVTSQRGIQEEARRRGYEMPDGFVAMGVDVDDRGCLLAGGVAHPRLTEAGRNLWMRLAAHFGAGYRLRRTLESRRSPPEAVLEPGGKVLHAQGEACSVDARGELADICKAIERARTVHGRRQPEESLPRWRTLVSAHWTLVDALEADGRRLVVAHDNRPRRHPVCGLSSRERQALALLALEQTNKQIAFALGISASTVGVLLHRAAQKLGTATRPELIIQAKALESVADERPSFT